MKNKDKLTTAFIDSIISRMNDKTIVIETNTIVKSALETVCISYELEELKQSATILEEFGDGSLKDGFKKALAIYILDDTLKYKYIDAFIDRLAIYNPELAIKLTV